MPGPFTHIYTARRIADFLASDQITGDFIRPRDGRLLPEQQLAPNLVAELGHIQCAAAMKKWEKFTAVGAMGPDLFFWMQDYNNSSIPCDEIMLAMSMLYYLDDQGRVDDPWEGLLKILAEISGTWANIVRFIIKLDQIWKKFLKWWNDTIGPIIEKAGQVIDDLTGGLMSQLADALTELKNGLIALAEEEIFEQGDIFGWFSLKMRKGFDEQAFLWSDMTHYRRTSVIPAQFISRARDMLKSTDPLTIEHGEQLLAFALGWICHNGTDIIEHSFVNEQCGGPFRTHWQRHHLIENHIDAWNYQCTKDGTLPADDFVGWQKSYPSLPDSALYFALQIPQDIDDPKTTNKQGDLRKPLPEGTDSVTQEKRKELLDTDGALPMWLAETIVEVFIAIYADPSEGGDAKIQGPLNEGSVPHPRNLQGQQFQKDLYAGTAVIGKWLEIIGVNNAEMALNDLREAIAPKPSIANIPVGFPFPWEVQATYRFMLSWFKRQYLNTMDIDRPEPPTVFTPPSSDYTWGPPDMSGVNPSDDPVSQTCEALAAILDWVFKSLDQAAQFLYDIVKTIASAATWPARDVIYKAVILPLWEATENIRMVLVHMGYMMPQSEQRYDDTGDLRRPNEIDSTLITLGHTVDSAFASALASAIDVLGNLDNDPNLTNQGVRNPVLGAKNPWLPVRVPAGEPAPVIPKVTSDDPDPVVEFLRPWGFPDRTNSKIPTNTGNWLETPLTVAGPYPTDTMPNQLLTTIGPISNPARTLYQDAGCPGDTDLYNRAFVVHDPTLENRFDEDRYPGSNPLGDPVVFSAYLIGQIANNSSFLSSFNLDADRGYGYLCWDFQRAPMPVDPTTGKPAGPTDGQGNMFPPPQTWPEGADGQGNAYGTTMWTPPAVARVGDNEYATALKIWYRANGGKCKQPETPAPVGDGPPK
jgi:hypothetical protein